MGTLSFSGWVLRTLSFSIWCIMNQLSFSIWCIMNQLSFSYLLENS